MPAPSCLGMIALAAPAMVQLWVAWLGFAHDYGMGWAFLIMAMTFAMRFPPVLVIGTVLAAHDVWGWPWYWSALSAAALWGLTGVATWHATRLPAAWMPMTR